MRQQSLARTFAARLGAIVAAGVALRAIYTLVLARHVTGLGDWQFYHATANLIAHGQGFSDWYAALNQGREIPTAFHPPLYPLALSLVSRLGGTSELTHRLAGLVFGAGTIATLGCLGRRVGGERVGLVAAALAAVSPLLVATDGSLMSETLYGLLIAATLLAAYGLLDARTGRRAALLGATIGLAALTRSEAVLLVPLLAIPVAVRARRGRLRLAALAVGGCLLVLAPWGARNWLAFGQPLLISTNSGAVFLGANCEATYHGPGIGGWDLSCYTPRVTANEAEQAALWRDAGLRYARENLGRLPAVAGARLLRTWSLWPASFWEPGEGHLPRVDRAGIVVYFALVAFGAYGAAVLARRGEPLWILLCPALLASVTAVVGWGLPRLRYAFDLPLVVLAAAGAVALVEARRTRH